MRIRRNLRLSLAALSAHRLRATLAVAGSAVGVAGVLLVTAVGEGARNELMGRLDSLGRELLIVTPAPVDGRTRLLRGGSGAERSLVLDDAVALSHGSSTIRRAVPVVDGGRVVRAGRRRTPMTILGSTTDWPAVRRFALADGRFFNRAEEDTDARVAVLGADARAGLFADSTDAVGRTIRIGNVPFLVIGVLAPKGMSAGGTATEDDRIIVPIGTAMRRLLGVDYLRMILVEAVSPAALDDAGSHAADILRARHSLPAGRRDDFVIESQRALLDAGTGAQTTFRRILAGLGILSLVVAGIGLMAVMLLSIRERRTEIGLRVATGARRSDILVQFLAEASMLAAGGAVAGLPLGLGAAAITSAATAWTVRVSAVTLSTAMAAAVITGIASGSVPAWRAAVMDPIDALRSD